MTTAGLLIATSTTGTVLALLIGGAIGVAVAAIVGRERTW